MKIYQVQRKYKGYYRDDPIEFVDLVITEDRDLAIGIADHYYSFDSEIWVTIWENGEAVETNQYNGRSDEA